MADQLFLVGTDPVLRRLRRMRWPMLLGALVGLLAGFAVHQSATPTWTAQVALELPVLRDRVDLNATGLRGDAVTADTDGQMVLADPVVGAVAEADSRSLPQARAALSVSARPLSRILLISYTSTTPEGARAGAGVAGTQFLAERDRAYLAPQRAYLQAVADGTEQIPAGFDQIVVPGTAVPSGENLRRAAFVQSLELPSAGQVVSGPRMVSELDRGDLEVPVVTGLAVGALGGLLLVLVLDVLRRRPLPLPRMVVRRRHLRRHRQPLRRVLVGSLVVVAASTAVVGGAAAVVVPQRWTATALVYVPPLPGNAYESRGSANKTSTDLGTEAELARSDRVLGAVAAAPGIEAPVDQLRPRIKTAPSRRGESITIAVTGSTAGGTEQIAALVAQEFVQIRRERAVSWTTDRRDALDAATDGAQAALDTALGPDGDSALVNAYNRRVNQLRVDARRSDSTDIGQQGSVLTTGSAPDTKGRLLVLGAAGGGLLIGAVAAFATRGATRVPFASRGR